MKKILTNKEFKIQADYYEKIKYKCSCGHVVVIPVYVDKILCDWCNNYVFRDKKDEFKYRLKERINNERIKR